MSQNSSGSSARPLPLEAALLDSDRGAKNGSTNVNDTDSIISLYGRLYAPSQMSDNESIMISGSMPSSKVLAQLGRHGCKDVTSQLDPQSASRAEGGGFGDIYHGVLQDGRRVGIKCLRLFVGENEEGGMQVKNAAHELYVWSKLKHPNIQELIGVALFDNRVAMVSPWMNKGSLSRYLSRHPGVDRYGFCLQVATAVAYLREQKVVHGDIKGENFLVSEDHIVKLTDFGSSITSKCSLRFTSRIALPYATAPEIAREETQQTFEGDVYALGMTILEIITGSQPWDGLGDLRVVVRVYEGQQPPRPEAYLPIGDRLSDRSWELMTGCWASEPQQRPLATRVRDELDAICKQRQLTYHNEMETTGTDQISDTPDARTPMEPASNDNQAMGQSQTPVTESRRNILERLLRRPDRSSNSFEIPNNEVRLILPPSTSLTRLPQTQPPTPPALGEANSSAGFFSRTRWRSVSVSGTRRGQPQQPPVTPSIQIPRSDIPQLQSSVSFLDIQEQVCGQGSQPPSLEPVAVNHLLGSLYSLQLERRLETASTAAIKRPSRKALIIGGSPKGDDEVDWKFSTKNLKRVLEDSEQMESVFEERGYSVQTLLGGFDGDNMLAEVADFLRHAERGDVRAIVFAMYGYVDEDETIAFISPAAGGSRWNNPISYAAWEQNIRAHSPPGVIVFSIMANSFSSQVLKQEFDRDVWEVPARIKSIKEDEPIYLTFAASNEYAYAGGRTRDSEPNSIGDHFVHSLATAIRSVDAATGTWRDFFGAFDQQFSKTRSCVSLLEQERTGNRDFNWRLNHPQTPHFSASGSVKLSDIF